MHTRTGMVRLDRRMAVTYGVIVIWISMFLADHLLGLMPVLSGRGILALDGAYHRLFTGTLLHANALHLIANAAAMYWIGCHLERNLGSRRFLLLTVAAFLLAGAAVSVTLPQADNLFGGSVLLYAYIGAILTLRLLRPQFPRIRLGTWCGNGIALYAIIGNVPIFPFMNFMTLVMHAVSFALGLGIGALLAFDISREKA